MAQKKLVDPKTGESFDLWVDTEDDKQRKSKWKEKMLAKKEHEKLTGSFTFTLLSSIQGLIEDTSFTDDEKTRIMFLGTYVTYGESEYSKLQKGNGTPILKKHLQKLLMITHNKSFYQFYNRLIEKKIIIENGNGKNAELYWTSKYHFKGKASLSHRKEKNLIKLYDRQLRELYTSKDQKGRQKYRPSNLYILFCMLPFVNYETNLLSVNADIPASETRPLLLSELAIQFGLTRSSSLKRKLLNIKLADSPVFSIITEADKEYVRVNPYIVWRNTSEPPEAITQTFKATKEFLISRQEALPGKRLRNYLESNGTQ
ncbi:hypothetical protein ACQCVE_00250 [Metabacillus sp. 113a]|uniref:hypothetical protein n=1 Tax=Metabacillus sp. 113a TaxID=3404706 RepID=UPI003CEC4157